MPRITTGSARGITLKSVPDESVRPTSDRAKQAVFSALGTRVSRSTFLDMYAGTGQMGLEALSRGCPRAVLVEKDRRLLPVLKENCRRTQLNPEILMKRASQATERFLRTGERFDIIYMDPPWPIWEAEAAHLKQFLPDLLAPDGVLIMEHPKRTEPDLSPLTVDRVYHYGQTTITFWTHEKGARHG